MQYLHHKFSEIDQFRDIIRLVRDRARYHNVPLPVLKFQGTVKLHGTNAGVVLDPDNNLYAQSRNRVLSLDDDNSGFAKFVDDNKSFFFRLLLGIKNNYGSSTSYSVVIHGEWCGQGIMRGVAINQLPKMFVIFEVSLANMNVHERLNEKDFGDILNIPDVPDHVFSVLNFPYWSISIDFADPQLSQNQLVSLTDSVEKECPVAKHFGISGVGEGIVWTCYEPDVMFSTGRFIFSDLRFKVKGEKHSESKVKSLAAVDVEKVATVKAFVDKVVTEHRLEKIAYKMQHEDRLPADVKNTGEFIKRVCVDVLKEEKDTIEASGLDWKKEVSGAVTSRARQWFLHAINVIKTVKE